MNLAVVFVLVILFLYLQNRYYFARCFNNTTYRIHFSSNGVFENEKIELEEEFSNKKWLPLWWVRTSFRMPWELNLDRNKKAAMGTFYNITYFFSIMPFEKIIRRHRVTAVKRGYYQVGSLSASSGDLLNNSKITAHFESDGELYVYPRLIPMSEFRSDFIRVLGEIITKRNVVEDQYILRGIREYSPFDSFRHINWQATAKTGELKVNQYDYTKTQQVFIIMDCRICFSDNPTVLKEMCIRLSATLCSSMLKNNIAVGFSTNAVDCEKNEPANIAPDVGNGQNIKILKMLARLNPDELVPYEKILSQPYLPMNRQMIYIFISQDNGDDLLGQYEIMKKLGYDTLWVFPVDETCPLPPIGHDVVLWKAAR